MKITPLFRKLIDGQTFGELDTKPVEEPVVQEQKPETHDKYMIIRRGKVVGWGRI